MLLELLLSEMSLLRQTLATFRQFGQADHLSLVCFEQAAIGAVHPVHARLKLLIRYVLPGLRDVTFGNEPLELC